MSQKHPLGPFRPGFGGQPPYLAGRESEQELLRSYLNTLAGGLAPGSAVVLNGPRGNGKTVLLGWLESEAERHPSIETVTLQPSTMPDAARLAELLLPQPWWQRLLTGGIWFGGFSGKLEEGRRPPVNEVLASRANRSPLLLLVDEAHTLDLEVGRALLNAAQHVSAKLPCLLVLAGTPQVEARLSAMGASFWSRAEQVRVGRLDREATAEAFRRPFETDDIPMESDALASMVRESQQYPYFIQLLGRSVWRRVTGPEVERRVTTHLVSASAAEFERAKHHYYAQRFEELTRRGLLAVASAVAAAFRDSPVLNRPALDAALARGLGRPKRDPSELAAALDGLAQLGFVWRVEERPDWEPGIPSLMDYVREFAPTT